MRFEVHPFVGPKEVSTFPLADVMPALVSAQLEKLPYVEVGPDADYVLRGSLAAHAKGFEVSAVLVDAQKKDEVAQATTACAASEVARCAHALGRMLRGRLDEVLEEGAVRSTAEPPGSEPPRRPLQLAFSGLRDVFPARIVGARDPVIGTLELTNRSTETVRNILLTVRAPLLGAQAINVPVDDVGPQARREVPVRLVIDHDHIGKLRENRSVVLAVDVEYSANGLRIRDHQAASALAFSRNAMDWSVLESVASFVTPEAPTVRAMAERAAAVLKAHPPSPALGPVVLHAALRQWDLRYRPDPAVPFGGGGFDYVRFPEETLEKKEGDCDDLSVLVAAVAEAAAVRALIVSVPGHVLVALGTAMPPQGVHLVTDDPGRVLIFDSEVFIPIEATRAADSFLDAWDEGASRVRGLDAPQLQIVDLREAWKEYPPANLIEVESAPAVGLDGLEDAVRGVLRELEEGRKRRRAQALRALERELSKGSGPSTLLRMGVALAKMRAFEDARSILRRAAGQGVSRAAALANLGNLALLDGAMEAALTFYRRALGSASPRERGLIHADAALGAWLLGDQEAFGMHVLQAVEYGASAHVEVLTRAGLEGRAQGAKGGGPASPIQPDGYLHWLGVD